MKLFFSFFYILVDAFSFLFWFMYIWIVEYLAANNPAKASFSEF